MPNKDPSPESIVLGEFREYLSHRRGKRLAGFKKQPAAKEPEAGGECAACVKGDCDNPDHLDEEIASGLDALAGDDSPKDNPGPGEKAYRDRQHAPDSDYW